MGRWIRRILASLVVVIASAAAVGAVYQRVEERRDLARTPAPGQLVDVGGYRLHIWCKGSGDPAVILESGLGDAAFIWSDVHEQVAQFARVCAYDRAGMGYSDGSPASRTSQHIAAELATLLTRAHLDGGVVLVGASLGGFNIRMFAFEYPERTAGLVLVDSSHEGQSAGFSTPAFAPLVPWAGSLGVLRVLGVMSGTPDRVPEDVRRFQQATAYRTARFQAMHDELMAIPESAAQVRASRSHPLTAPLIAVASGRNSSRDKQWDGFQRDLATLSSRGCHIIADKAGHLVSRDNPDLVTEAIRATIAAATEATGPPCAFMAHDVGSH
jgi:pimeloyl-ACP methyl ester carboxylesterase